jgi:hypothetical protein
MLLMNIHDINKGAYEDKVYSYKRVSHDLHADVNLSSCILMALLSFGYLHRTTYEDLLLPHDVLVQWFRKYAINAIPKTL